MFNGALLVGHISVTEFRQGDCPASLCYGTSEIEAAGKARSHGAAILIHVMWLASHGSPANERRELGRSLSPTGPVAAIALTDLFAFGCVDAEQAHRDACYRQGVSIDHICGSSNSLRRRWRTDEQSEGDDQLFHDDGICR